MCEWALWVQLEHFQPPELKRGLEEAHKLFGGGPDAARLNPLLFLPILRLGRLPRLKVQRHSRLGALVFREWEVLSWHQALFGFSRWAGLRDRRCKFDWLLGRRVPGGDLKQNWSVWAESVAWLAKTSVFP